MTDNLAVELGEVTPGVRVDQLADGVWRVLVPSTRWVHDYLTLTVEAFDGGWVVSDGGELAGLVGDEAPELIRYLECAGADLDLAEEGVVTTLVASDEPIASRVLSFAHFVSAAPVVWHARDCMSAPAERDQTEAPSRRLARAARDRLVARLGGQSEKVIHLQRKVRERGETVRIPLVVAPPQPFSLPLLLAAFVDMEASEQSVAAAKRSATWAFEVVHDLTIPKYLLVNGESWAVDHFAEFFDHHNVTALSYAESTPFEADTRSAIQRLGLTVQ